MLSRMTLVDHSIMRGDSGGSVYRRIVSEEYENWHTWCSEDQPLDPVVNSYYTTACETTALDRRIFVTRRRFVGTRLTNMSVGDEMYVLYSIEGICPIFHRQTEDYYQDGGSDEASSRSNVLRCAYHPSSNKASVPKTYLQAYTYGSSDSTYPSLSLQ